VVAGVARLLHRAEVEALALLGSDAPPLAVVGALDAAALDLEDGEACARPSDEEVDLPLRVPVRDAEVVEDDGITGQLLPELVPHRLLATTEVAFGEVGWEEARHVPHLARSGSGPFATRATSALPSTLTASWHDASKVVDKEIEAYAGVVCATILPVLAPSGR
jgi:hypothetical protein